MYLLVYLTDERDSECTLKSHVEEGYLLGRYLL